MGGDQPPGSPVENPLNILILYDRRMLYTNTVREHVESFSRYSRHRIAYAHAAVGSRLTFSLEPFDVIVVHYSIRLAYPDMISPEFAWAIKAYQGLKALFIQDEYDHTWRACQWIEQLGIRLVYSCVPPQHVRAIYSKVDHSRVVFRQTLTGFLPTDSDLKRHIKPLSSRLNVIGYRGRALPFRYGRLGQEKLTIGVRMKQECEKRGICCDIAWTEDKRIYGDAWVDFVASCRATLGTESGSNVFDFDGSLSVSIPNAIEQNPKITYEDAERQFLRGRELDGVMNQISPRIFEAVALRTGLILFEGTYSGVVRPDEHFVPLRKDFANVDEVLRRVQDDRELEAMTERAYRHVIESGLFTYQAFMREVDDVLASHTSPDPKLEQPSPGGWTREPDMQDAWFFAVRGTWRGAARRIGHRTINAVHRFSGMRKLLPLLELLRGTRFLGVFDPVLRNLGRPTDSTDQTQRLRERFRLGLLHVECRNCPSVYGPLWTTIRYEPSDRRIVFTTHPVHFLPPVILDGGPVLHQAINGILERKVSEIVWEHPLTSVEMGKLGILKLILGKDASFRFTTLERLADLEPEKAARVLAHVGAGVRAIPVAKPAESERSLRQAS